VSATTRALPAARTMTPRLWFALLAPPFAWAVHGLCGWFIAAHACRSGSAAWGPLSGGAVRVLLAAIGVTAIAVCTAGAVAGYRAWHPVRGHRLPLDASERPEFAALAGLLISSVFLLAAAWTTLPAFIVGVCGDMR
jgi:hypothetical protein